MVQSVVALVVVVVVAVMISITIVVVTVASLQLCHNSTQIYHVRHHFSVVVVIMVW